MDRVLTSLDTEDGYSSFPNGLEKGAAKLDDSNASADAASAYTRTIDGMEDTAFKRAYMDNVRANQFQSDGVTIKSEFGGLQNIESHDQILLEGLLKQQQSNNTYKKMLVGRQRLPSYKMKDEILDLVKNNQAVVLSGETGCGKTTQVPQFLLESEILAGRGSACHVVCTQPRRISAISVAQRVADERGERVGDSVGYQIRLEAARSRDCGSIMYCTSGIVLQWLQSDSLLSKVSHLVLDEIHERDMQSDFLISIARDLLTRRPDLKLILMSATLNAAKFSEYYGGCAMIHIPGFTFPVKEYYLEDVIQMTRFRIPEKPRGFRPSRSDREESNSKHAAFTEQILPWISEQQRTGAMTEACAQELSQPHSEVLCPALVLRLLQHICSQPPGAVLVFLPGWSDISEVDKLIKEDSSMATHRTAVYPLHSLMPTVNQREVFERPPTGVRKIVLATNIAETSITIDDIVYVIDGGYIKMRNFDKRTNMSTLLPELVTKANAHQRRGRAGRVQDGVCYHLYTSKREKLLDDYPLPEVMRTRLEEIILSVKILKLGQIKAFLAKLMQPPDEDVVDMSVKLLEAINALDEDENLTPLGFHLAKLPVDPLTGRMLLMGAIFSCVDPILTVAAVGSFKEPFNVPLGKEREVDDLKLRFAGNTKSDHLMYVKAYDAWRSAAYDGDQGFCWRNFIAPTVMKQIQNMRKQFFGLLKEYKFVDQHVLHSNSLEVNRNSGNLAVVRAIVTSGLYPNVARVFQPRRQVTHNKKPPRIRLADQTRASLHPKCVIKSAQDVEFSWLVYKEKMKMKQVLLFDASNVPNYPLLLFGKRLVFNERDSVIDVDGFVKVKCSRQVAEVMRKLRQELDALLQYKISHPGATEWSSNSSEGKLLGTIVDLLSSEKVDLEQQRSDDPYGDEHQADDEDY